MKNHTLLHFFVVEGYLWDWLTAAAGIVINLIVPAHALKPLDRYYSSTDPTLSYPVKGSSVPSSALYVLVFVLPAVVFAMTAAIRRSGGLVDWHHAALSIAEGFALATGFKRWTNLVGVLRPSWLGTVQKGVVGDVEDARLSYPSGHSAYMFFSMTVLSLYLLGKLQLLSRPSQLLFLKSVLALAPLALALFVAVSRIADYKHSPADVNAGCFIGMLCGGFAYFLNYPSLFSPDSAEPRRRGVGREDRGSGKSDEAGTLYGTHNFYKYALSATASISRGLFSGQLLHCHATGRSIQHHSGLLLLMPTAVCARKRSYVIALEVNNNQPSLYPAIHRRVH
ncbi:hypothetical protein VOLCADRAFT_121142 [Volvox carteri f. nagariensis]|uniref:Phosphatidic acid phosphatase type 2/haloperoxidase domain-containing protein n=1 Tax=Volvox carteri f. nagariensis TaxID=3068 RepID=D8U380_VOLCA|nr:uncharacterized protein VOLCADRAFT_121142 [Volvox carteri f. nagariensis]EFJ45779.1 hypothetical protein VOLCADRAFT_121142 [Volvox carteri f. nagariensis]|eukprot:XP_002953180.1 hypothetical protein VOLCADRAFT_121142 [Volvox carteri f. nagariensis]